MRLEFIFLFAFSMALQSSAVAETVPHPKAASSLETSEAYQVFADGRAIWTEKLVSRMDIDALPEWFDEPYVTAPQEVHLANFSCSGKQSIQIELEGSASSVVVRPLSRGIKPSVDGNTIQFVMAGPDYLVVEVDDRPPLFLLADPVESEPIASNADGVRYFGPGEHRVGYLELEDNQTIYLAPGAIVYGGIRGKNVRNARVCGRGILDGDFEYKRLVLLEGCENVVIEGITMRNGHGWTNSIYHSRNVEYRNVKVISFGPSGDGINPLGTQDMRIKNCFLRCTDDCIAIKSPDERYIVKNITVEECTMIGHAYADAVTIGFETNGEAISDVVVRNCDVLMSRGGSRVDGHSAFSIICDGPADIHNILYEDIRVERAEEKLFELHVTDGTKYGVNPPGRIRDIRLRNIRWLQDGPIALQGFAEDNGVEGVVFEDCRVAERELESLEDPAFRIGPYVRDVRFE